MVVNYIMTALSHFPLSLFICSTCFFSLSNYSMYSIKYGLWESFTLTRTFVDLSASKTSQTDLQPAHSSPGVSVWPPLSPSVAHSHLFFCSADSEFPKKPKKKQTIISNCQNIMFKPHIHHPHLSEDRTFISGFAPKIF